MAEEGPLGARNRAGGEARGWEWRGFVGYLWFVEEGESAAVVIVAEVLDRVSYRCQE